MSFQEVSHRRARCLRPLRAVGSKLYEPEAIGHKAYSPTRRARVYEPEAAPGLRLVEPTARRVGDRRDYFLFSFSAFSANSAVNYYHFI